MNRKKIITGLLSIIILFSLVACNDIQKEQDKRKENLLAIQGKGNHYFIDKEGYIKDNKRVYFSDLIMKKIETDGILSIPKPEQSQTKKYDINAKLFKGYVYFTMPYRISEDNKNLDVIVGYIEIKSEKITYYNTQISTEEAYGIDLLPLMANDEYFIFKQPRESLRKDVYYIIDLKNNSLFEKITDINSYTDGTEDDANLISFNDKQYEIIGNFKDGVNVLRCGEETLTIDYAYVLERSDTMSQINAIMGNYIKKVREHLISYENRLYIVIESINVGMPFGTGELIPVVFEYNFEKDSFDYIGATDLTRRAGNVYIFGIIPETK